MTQSDETIRNVLTDALTREGVDARNLGVEVTANAIRVEGTVPTEEQRSKLASILDAAGRELGSVSYLVEVKPVAQVDSADGRGRSPVTGTSADSAHESRHRLDVE